LLSFPHIVEEKVDGSQFSFGKFIEPGGIMHSDTYILRVRSKGVEMNPDAPEKMFQRAVDSVVSRFDLLHPGWTYRCEYLARPNHNTLGYDRVPDGYLIGFDVSTGAEEWLDPIEKLREFNRIGLECVPLLARGGGDTTAITLDDLRTIITNTKPHLGGPMIEGIVVKPFRVGLFGEDGKTLMGKFVSERFKESHGQVWKDKNPTSGDIIQRLTSTYRVEPRWYKAIQHLREAGELEDSPRDIGKLLVEIERDFGQECKEEVMRSLWKWAYPHVARGIKAGFVGVCPSCVYWHKYRVNATLDEML